MQVFKDSYLLERQTAVLAEQSNGMETAKALGIAENIFHNVREASSIEQLDIQHMNVAIWPSTWGYFLEQMMAGDGSLSDDMIRYGREHFEHFVRGRGPLPAIRIANQPYGLLPVMSLDHWQAQGAETMDVALEKFLSKLREVWRRSLPNVPRVPGNLADPEAMINVLANDTHLSRLRDASSSTSFVGFFYIKSKRQPVRQ